MASHREVEIKLRVRQPARIKQRIRQLGFRRLGPRALETNVLFDYPDRRLFQAGSALRLRSVGGKSLLTFKGPPAAAPRYKDREEVETEAENAAALRQILRRLGLVPVFTYRKHRTTYAPPADSRAPRRSLLLYDETPAGTFLELEGSPRWIDRTARELGYRPEDYITASYITLYFASQSGQTAGPASGPVVAPRPDA
ncbi:MAG: class IV adenylate cyclase [Terriglobia bacterium]